MRADFNISKAMLGKIIADFHSEMGRGLAGKPSSLQMIPTYVDRASGEEKGRFMALDLGGTNFRVLALELKGNGRASIPRARKYALRKEHITGAGEALFDFIADRIKDFLHSEGLTSSNTIHLGFTFSFPVKQKGVASGLLVKWTKGFCATGVEGKDVVTLLDDAIKRKGLDGITVSALVNDTVGTLVAESYADRDCDMGVILGTGTNACYVENVSNIKKWRGPAPARAHMIINIEWGNFNRLPLTQCDKELDAASDRPGEQILEKMVSGMYLGEVVRLALKRELGREVMGRGVLTSEHVSAIVGDRTPGLLKAGKIFSGLGAGKMPVKDISAAKRVCAAVSTRAARISAAAMAAVLTKTDPSLRDRHTVAIDGSVYEKHPDFSKNMKTALREIFGKGASNIKMVLAKDGSGKGAAIIAAIAAGE